MAKHTMTARRKAALRKAQLISARLRRGKHSFSHGKKLSKGHKRAIATAVAGVAVAGGVYATSAWMNKTERKARVDFIKKNREEALRKVRSRRMSNSPDMTTRRNVYKDAWTNKEISIHEDTGNPSAASKVVRLKGQIKVHTSVQHPFAKAIMNELHGSAVVGGHSRRNGGKYKVIYNG